MSGGTDSASGCGGGSEAGAGSDIGAVAGVGCAGAWGRSAETRTDAASGGHGCDHAGGDGGGGSGRCGASSGGCDGGAEFATAPEQVTVPGRLGQASGCNLLRKGAEATAVDRDLKLSLRQTQEPRHDALPIPSPLSNPGRGQPGTPLRGSSGDNSKDKPRFNSVERSTQDGDVEAYRRFAAQRRPRCFECEPGLWSVELTDWHRNAAVFLRCSLGASAVRVLDQCLRPVVDGCRRHRITFEAREGFLPLVPGSCHELPLSALCKDIRRDQREACVNKREFCRFDKCYSAASVLLLEDHSLCTWKMGLLYLLCRSSS